MGNQSGPERVAGERRRLDCSVCGAANRLAPRVLEEGFLTCSHCNCVIPVAGAGSFAVRNPAGGFTRLIAPGSSLFVLVLGRVLGFVPFLFVLVVCDVAGTVLHGMLGFFGAPPALAWSPVVLAGLVILVAIVLLIVEQRILVTQNRVETWWRLFGRDWRRRRLATHGLRVEPATGLFKGLLLRPLVGAHVRVRTEDEPEATILKAELEEAIGEARVPMAPDRVPCPGCGAPVASSFELIASGGVDCSRCGAGLVHTGGGVALGEAHLSLRRVSEPGPRTWRRHVQDGLEWRLPPEARARPLSAAAWLLGGLVCGGALIVAGVAMFLWSTPYHGLGLLFGLMAAAMGVGIIIRLGLSSLYSHRLLLDRTVLLHELRLGPLRLLKRRFPLARLLEMKGERRPIGLHLRFTTALQSQEIEMPLLDGQAHEVADELVEALAERLRDLRRPVRMNR